jgi:beta-glucanase (GH16 family)
MKHTIALLIIIILLSGCSFQANNPDTEWRLVFADEFNADGRPDPNNWTYEQGFVRNRELQWYQPENAFCENGRLVIEGRREKKPNPNYRPQSRRWQRNREYAEYTSACLKTRGLHEWLYGRFEIRAKIDARPGLWPAIWTLGSARGWPGCGEIDIMEYYDDSILANACWSDGSRNPAWDTVKKPLAELGGSEWAATPHIWRMEWDPEFIRLYVDDILLNTIEIDKTIHPDLGISPFREPHYILLNLAIGGTQGGDPSGTTFPSRYEIDYVRVYQKQLKE